MDPRYDHKELENKIYKTWEESGFFSPEGCVKAGVTSEKSDYFSMVLPPPNVTGTLHTGHATMLAIEDIMVRYARMKGLRTLWIPGTDHAAIATQVKVEKKISKEEGKTRHDLGREEFLKRVDQFAKESHDTIVNQVKRMGSSLDWNREAFTLDEKRNFAVRTAFKKMYDDGLIYRGDRIINWDTKGQTAISDDEIVYDEREAILYTFRYSSDFPIAISTTRPETKIGDTAVAVHPDDARYKKFVGQTYKAEFCGVPLEIKIVTDESVDPKFGTGALGVTPAHSMTDWEIAQRHKLEVKPVIDERGKMTVGEKLTGKKTLEAREIIVAWLKENNLIEREEKVKQNVSTSERTGAVIEPLPKLQWFIDVNKKFAVKDSKIPSIKTGEEITLKELMARVVKSGEIKIMPERFEKVYYNWIENLRDWCISRQIWYGHRIPAWYHEPKCVPKAGHEEEVVKCKELIVSIDKPKCEFCDAEYIQDPDTLDTWFSAGLWTFSTLGWPEETADLKNYHPTTILETGYDIIFFWVARMILMTGYLLNDIPFRKVYLHGLMRDAQGRKMSKSLDNTIDPLTLIEKYGADAMRLSLIIGAAPGNDLKFSEDRIRGYRNFSTKIWNIARFVLANAEGANGELTAGDKKLVEELGEIKKTATQALEDFDFNKAGETIYHYVWHTFADKIIEEAKPRLNSEDASDKASAQTMLLTILKESLKMLHPFMPFVTEEIWSKIPDKEGQHKNLLIIEKW